MNSDLVCREIEHGSSDYRSALALREAVLREPLGMTWRPEDLAAEATSRHFGCFVDGVLRGTLVLVAADADGMRMRQVAIAPDWQRRGLGAALIRYAEQAAAAAGFRRMTAHARDVAVPFYQQQGYEIEGEGFTEIGVLHFTITKRLPRAS